MSDTGSLVVSPRQIGVATALAAVVFGVVDALWLGLASGDLYERMIGHLLSDDVNVAAAVVFYVVYVLGLVHFVIRPGLSRVGLGPSLRDAFVFGVVTYATFDLTSMAVMRSFPVVVAVVDIAWGAFICTLTAAVVIPAVRRWVPTD
ncbi:DUF2177 family protein [Oryzobacter telluris]|uniref:DUF2177 family protein n=1 Tax=Oryzobacter telluris TaxID=3149179 RepID=UPI00370D65E0